MSDSTLKSPTRAFIVLLFGMWVIMVVQTTSTPAYPSIMADLQFEPAYVSWIKAFNALASAVLAPVMGRFGDLAGLKKAALFGLGGFTVGTFMLGVAPALPVYLAGQFIQGLGMASTMPATMAFIGRFFPAEKVAKYFSLYGAVITSGPIFGPLISSLFLSTDFLGWRVMYYFGGGLAAVAFIMAFFLLPKIAPLPQANSKFDVSGSVCMFISVGSFLLMPTLASLNGWLSPMVLVLLFLFLSFGLAFVIMELKKSNPLIDLRFVGTRAFGVPMLFFIIFNAILSSVMYMLSYVVVFGLGQPAAVTGMIFSFMYIIMVISNLAVGKLMERFKWRTLAFVPVIFYLCAMLIFASLSEGSSVLLVYTACFLIGIANSFATPLFMTAALSTIPDESLRGSASGTFSMLGNLGGPIGIAVLLPLLTSLATMPDGTMNYMVSFPQVSLVMAAMVVVCFALAFFFPKHDPRAEVEAAK